MYKYRVYPYKGGSQGAKNLARGLGALRIKTHGSRYRPYRNHIIINWGATRIPDRLTRAENLLNHPEAVEIASNKTLTFATLSGDGLQEFLPPWTPVKGVAAGWNKRVVCRRILNGHGGAGIVIAHTPQEIVDAPLYTQYIPKRKEFRVHVAFGHAIDVQEKRRRREHDVDNYVRSFNNGWVFCRDGIIEPDGLRALAISAVEALGLHFGACDIIWNEKYNRLYVLEINSAPGMEGTTIANYVAAFNNYKQRNFA